MEIETIAKKLGMDPKELVEKSLKTWIEVELMKLNAKIIEIFGRYNVSCPEELEKKIETGEVPEHPAWEDLIDLENYIAARNKLLEVAKLVEESE